MRMLYFLFMVVITFDQVTLSLWFWPLWACREVHMQVPPELRSRKPKKTRDRKQCTPYDNTSKTIEIQYASVHSELNPIFESTTWHRNASGQAKCFYILPLRIMKQNEYCERRINLHYTSMGQRKIWVPQQESNPWPPEHRAGAPSTATRTHGEQDHLSHARVSTKFTIFIHLSKRVLFNPWRILPSPFPSNLFWWFKILWGDRALLLVVKVAMLVVQTRPLGIELYFYASSSFCLS